MVEFLCFKLGPSSLLVLYVRGPVDFLPFKLWASGLLLFEIRVSVVFSALN